MASAEPYSRDRTLLFLSYRDSAARPSASTSSAAAYYATPDLESRALLDDVADDDGGPASGARRGSLRDALPPKWVDVAERVDLLLVGIRPKLEKLDKLHAKHLLPGFKDRSAEEREIEALANDITSDFRKTQSHIKHIAQLASSLLADSSSTSVSGKGKGKTKEKGKSATKKPGSRAELIMAANVQTALATKVQELSSVFRKKQTAYLRRLKGAPSPMPSTPAAGLMSPTGYNFSGNPTTDPLLSLASDESYLSQTLSQQQQQSLVPGGSNLVDQRATEIVALAQSITDLSDLFKDLSSLVLDQGTVLDRVDWNVEQMAGSVRGAERELKVAQGHQRRSGKCQLMFLLILLIIAAIVVIAYKPRRSSGPTPPPSPASPTAAGGTIGIEEALAIEEVESGRRRRKPRGIRDQTLAGWRPRGRRRVIVGA